MSIITIAKESRKVKQLLILGSNVDVTFRLWKAIRRIIIINSCNKVGKCNSCDEVGDAPLLHRTSQTTKFAELLNLPIATERRWNRLEYFVFDIIRNTEKTVTN